MAFEINYFIGSLDTYFRQDEMSVLFFYAKDIDLELTKKLNYLLDKKTSYMIHHNMNISGLDNDDPLPAYYHTDDIEAAIRFISTQLIPAMEKETVNMDEKYGGSMSRFIDLINNYPNDSLGFMLYVAHDYVPYEMTYYIDQANEMKDLLQESLNLKTPIIINYTD
ncbi:hypothetical protein DBR39_14155 [Chryseobacterium sp. KBW03]|uniref:hypothetical protein n=1 Tax=Chryseobacterium sp. KBW03 TaxID=2153362 RepID=UPI000F58F431|nr:hypothetical protein [Chryseobacterium sp. KBW03]RQO38023.1 hypothetical protein DBR39_14155 [Chryseobacterium sp. KBW03]